MAILSGENIPAPDAIHELVERFDYNLASYKSGQYNEAQLRLEFLNPFFEALGWDVHNKKGYAENYKEVIYEDAIKVGEQTKAPDYGFRIGGVRKFFVEAKKPSVNIKMDVSPAFQLRRYAWSAKLPLSILTDFEEFAVYDCRIKPSKTDKASTGRVLILNYKDYAERWSDIAGVFAREQILRGSFDKYVESKKAKRGTAEVDDVFLDSMEEWRLILARNLALRNTDLSPRELNYAVQQTIDRIIFLRMCEDRGIEDYGRLRAATNGEGIYGRLKELFYQADFKYNSGLFYFENEKGRGEPDSLTPGLTIDDKVLKEIITNLYYPDSPYVFSQIPAEILGQVYEQFLGKVIHVSPGRRVKVEEKPEVRKAGGVYYTPDYIVDYIVKQTVGRLVTSRDRKAADEPLTNVRGSESSLTPRQMKNLRILDPACGSGSFLVAAYQFLVDKHLQWYQANDPEKQKAVFQGKGGDWFLTTDEKKSILTKCIYGVDIDPQAVEVTKLSLLLKVLEGENQERLENYLRLFHERALPDLSDNIKCGNSLIGSDFYDNQEMGLFDEETRYRINVFDWEQAFPWLKKAGGFDAVIGNPPYGFHQIHPEIVKPYYKARYVSSSGSFEHYFLFYEASLRLLRPGGYHGFIVPVTWLTIPSAHSLRKFILDNFALLQIAWLPELVFRNAQVNTLVSVIGNATPKVTRVLVSKSNDPNAGQGITREFEQTVFSQANHTIHIFEGASETIILNKMDVTSVPLSTFARPCSGYNPYEVGKGTGPDGKPQTIETVRHKPYHSSVAHDSSWKPEAIGRFLQRYHVSFPTNRFIKYGPWLAAARDPKNFVGARILVQEITGGSERRIIAAFCDCELYHSRDIIPIKCENSWPSPLFLLGVINSWLVTWRHHRRNPKAKKALFPKVLVGDLKKLPIPNLEQTNTDDSQRHDRMVSLVDQMLALHQQLATAKLADDKRRLRQQIDATDRQIDRLVYDLYGLTEEEIGIVEKGAT